jgi:hypothetical protein
MKCYVKQLWYQRKVLQQNCLPEHNWKRNNAPNRHPSLCHNSYTLWSPSLCSSLILLAVLHSFLPLDFSPISCRRHNLALDQLHLFAKSYSWVVHYWCLWWPCWNVGDQLGISYEEIGLCQTSGVAFARQGWWPALISPRQALCFGWVPIIHSILRSNTRTEVPTYSLQSILFVLDSV